MTGWVRYFVCGALALATALPGGRGAAQTAEQDYPSRTVKIVVPFGAGGPTDVFTRAIAEELKNTFRQSFVMENRPGAGSVIGTETVAKAAPDGYTLLMISGTQTVNETLVAKKSYQLLRDFIPVAPLIRSDLVLVVHPTVPAKTLPELIALARAKPGKLNFASSGPGSNYHMAAELLKNLTGIDIVHVPYKGSTGARNDILGGQVEMMFDSVPTMAQMAQNGLVRALATAEKHDRRTCRTCRRSPKPAFQATRLRYGPDSPRPRAPRPRSSRSSTVRLPRSSSAPRSNPPGRSKARCR